MNLYLFVAYLLVWTALFLYLVFVQRRQKAVSERLERLEEVLRRRGEQAAEGE